MSQRRNENRAWVRWCHTESWMNGWIKGCVCVCVSPTESFSMKVECHKLPEDNLFDCEREREKERVGRDKGRAMKRRGGGRREGVQRQIERRKIVSSFNLNRFLIWPFTLVIDSVIRLKKWAKWKNTVKHAYIYTRTLIFSLHMHSAENNDCSLPNAVWCLSFVLCHMYSTYKLIQWAHTHCMLWISTDEECTFSTITEVENKWGDWWINHRTISKDQKPHQVLEHSRTSSHLC